MMRYFCYTLVLNLAATSLFAGIPEINVKIGSQVERLKITSKNDFDFHFLRGEHEHKSSQKKLEFDCNFKVSSKNKTVLFASLVSKSKKSELVYKDKGFGGHIKLATSEKRGCDIIQTIRMNHYLESLLSKEMNGSWPLEALKAQAVAARSYAMDKMKKTPGSNFNIISGEIHQVSGSSEDVTPRTRKAVKDTHGEILVNNESDLVPGFYHAECGGKTFDPIDVWSGHMFDYSPTTCPYCHKKTKHKFWLKKVSKKKMIKFLTKYYRHEISEKAKIEVVDSKKIHLRVDGRSYIFLPSDFRKSHLSLKIKSNNFEILNFKSDVFTLKGSGRGHGVGMCQLGALRMAELGYNYKQILNFYYPKLNIKKVY